MQVDRRLYIASLGGAAAVQLMSHEARAEALEAYMIQQLNPAASQTAPQKFPKAADIEAQIETRFYRRGVGNLFLTRDAGAKSRVGAGGGDGEGESEPGFSTRPVSRSWSSRAMS